jgi:TMPIT-like protein
VTCDGGFHMGKAAEAMRDRGFPRGGSGRTGVSWVGLERHALHSRVGEACVLHNSCCTKAELYCSTTLGEVGDEWVQLNGSSIRQWWIQHHYCSMVTTLIILTLPVDSPAVQTFVFRLLSWSVAQVLSPFNPFLLYDLLYALTFLLEFRQEDSLIKPFPSAT